MRSVTRISLSSFSILQPHAEAAAWVGVLTANNILNLSGALAAGRGKQEFYPDWRQEVYRRVVSAFLCWTETPAVCHGMLDAKCSVLPVDALTMPACAPSV